MKHVKKTTNKKTVQSTKVAGIFQQKSAMGQLTLALSDGKPRAEKQLTRLAGGANLSNRLFALGQIGKEKKLWLLNKRDDNKVQLKLLPGGKKALVKKVA